LHFSEKFGLTAVMARKRAGLPPLGGVGLKDETGSIPELTPSEASEEVDSLPADIYTKPINLAHGETQRSVVTYLTCFQEVPSLDCSHRLAVLKERSCGFHHLLQTDTRNVHTSSHDIPPGLDYF
jgi:hypothetical protein